MRAIHQRPIYARFHALVAMGFLFGIVYGSFSLVLPILADSIFANIAVLGLVFALPEFFGIFLDIPLGTFANRFGRRRTILCSGLLLAASAFFFIAFPHPLLFLLTLIFYEIATQAYIIPADAELMALSPGRRAGRFNGITEGFHNFGYAVGPMIAGWLLVWSAPYVLWFAFMGAIGMIILSMLFLPRETHGEEFSSSVGNVWRRDRVFIAGIREFLQLGFLGSYVAFLFFISAVHWGFISILEPIYTAKLGFDPTFIGLIFAGFTLPFLFVSFLAGRYVDIRGAKGVTIVGLLLLAISMIGFGFSTNPMVLFLFSLVHGVGEALLLTAIMSTIDKLSSYHTKERISGVKVFAESSGFFIGPLIAGVVTQLLGFPITFVFLGLATFLLTLFTCLVSFKIKPQTA